MYNPIRDNLSLSTKRLVRWAYRFLENKLFSENFSVSDLENLNSIKHIILQIREFNNLCNKYGIDLNESHNYDLLVFYAVMQKSAAEDLHNLLMRFCDSSDSSWEVIIERVLDWESWGRVTLDSDTAFRHIMHNINDIGIYTKHRRVCEVLGLWNRYCSNTYTVEDYNKLISDIDDNTVLKYLKEAVCYMSSEFDYCIRFNSSLSSCFQLFRLKSILGLSEKNIIKLKV